jgi:hypothetical protein
MRFREMYDAAFARLSHESPPSSPEMDAHVRAAEERLGARLPAALREIYLSPGASWIHGLRAANFSYSRVAMEEGALEFWDGYAQERVLGIAEADLGADDPPVLVGMGPMSDGWHYGGPVDWKPFVPSLSGFLLHALHVNAAYRHMRFRAWNSSSGWAMFPILRERFPEIIRGPHPYGMPEIVFGEEGRVITINEYSLHAGARTAEDAAAIEEATGGLLAPREGARMMEW